MPLGELLYERLRDYLPSLTSEALLTVGQLPDGEIRDLSRVIASELAAWNRAGPPLTDDQFAVAIPALMRLIGEPPEAADTDPSPA